MADRSWSLFFFFVILLFLSAPLSYAAAFLGELTESSLEKDSDAGKTKADRLLKFAARKERYLSVLRTGLTLAAALEFILLTSSFFSLPGRLAELFSADLPAALWEAITYLLLLLLGGGIHLLLGDMIPAELGRRKAGSDRIYRSTWLLSFLTACFTPFYLFFVTIAKGLLHLAGYRQDDAAQAVTEDEIRDMVDKGEESGGIERGEKEMIENIFEFTDITAGEVMTHRTDVAAIDMDSDDEEICRIIQESGYSRFPVYKNDIDSIKGILNAKTFLLDRTKKVKKPLSQLWYKPYFVPETIHADALLQEMKKKTMHMAIVIDEYGGTLGIVTMEDLLEEIVGNIYDETDDPLSEEELTKLDDVTWRAVGSLSISTLEEELDVRLRDEECDTLAGLIFSRMTLIPEDGSTPVLDIGRLHIEVEEIKNRRIEWAKITRLQEDEEEDSAEEASK